MKDQDINLLTHNESGRKAENVYSTPSFFIFGAIFIIALVVVIFSAYLHSKTTDLQSQADSIRSQISQSALKKEKILAVSERVGNIRKILGSRSDLENLISRILDAIPEGLTAQSVSAEDGLISIGLTSDSLLDFANLLDDDIPAISKDKKLGISLVKIDSFSQADNGYQMNLEFKLKGATN